MKVDVDIDACKKGEREALGNLYKAYSDKLMRICLHYVTDASTAEDILHDAFIIIFTSIKSLKDNSKLEGWMITIVRNLSLKYLQSTEKEDIPLSYLGVELLSEEYEEEKNIELELLLSAIELLPKENREVFKLSVLDGLSHKEIGELLGINPHSSSSQLVRAKKTLRTLLINYWTILLLPILIPVYIYFVTKDKFIKTTANKTTAVASSKKQPTQIQKEETTNKIERPKYSCPSSVSFNEDYSLAEMTVITENISSQAITDCIESAQQRITFHADSLQKYLVTKGIGTEDTMFRLPQISKDKIMTINNNMNINVNNTKKYPWTFNFGLSSSPSANGTSTLNYLSLIDYANGGAASKIYSWGEYIDYLDRNRMMMDSTENARLRQLAIDQFISADQSIGEKIHHYRPQTYSLSLSKQLNPQWILNTGLTYTRLKSEFESPFNNATLKKTQNIDYIGIPLRMTYKVWSYKRFNTYITGGLSFEIPIHSSLTKEFTITPDSSFTMKGNIHPHYQWSTNIGMGVQYQIIKPFSFYIEPNLYYYFRNGSGIQTYRTEHPFTFSIPFGLRLTW
ncbi:sigma-70 family RNA polymerase sigma factor [Bacteroides pyogenes]|uniref:sigma-70 family RNA polymerase sigma factor n=1 Tax=Bacteroides pyogenes TaxID=310300 RepID=UPI002FDB5509